MLLIQHGTLHTMETDDPVQADLLIRDGKIAKIGHKIHPDKDVEIINAHGLHIYPGFIDAHSHIGIAEEQTTAQTDSSNEGTNPVTPYIRAIDGINPMDSAFHNALAAGITGVMVGPGSSNPIGGQFAFIKTYGRCVDDMVVLAPAAIKLAFGENPMSTYGTNGTMPATRMGIASVIREELFQAQQYLKNDDASIVCDVLFSRENTDTVLFQLSLMNGAVISIASKAIQLINQNKLKCLLFTVLYHLLETLTIVRCTALGSVYVLSDYSIIVSFGIFITYSQLALNRLFRLAVAREPGIDDNIHFFTS